MNKRIALFFGMMAALFTATAGDHDAHDHDGHAEAFNPSNFIIHHIADAHDIHLWGDVHIPLPIILYSEEHGLDVFMSSAFEGHGDVRVAERPSGATYALSHGHIALAGDHDSHAGHDLTETMPVTTMMTTLTTSTATTRTTVRWCTTSASPSPSSACCSCSV